jgi:predicted phage baseplate assembly protein
MTVQFSDGISGRRLTTGRGNVSSTYRQGNGLAGNVGALALRTLLDRPVGLKSVSNPAAAAGGADPESLDQARSNAPNTVRTFGRIVSLRDFEDAARQFAGVAKAHSSWAWSGEEQVVYLTVAGAGGAPITGQTFADLVADLDSRRDPNRALRVRSYTAIPIQISATLFVAADYVAADVLTVVQAEVISYFSFENRQFGEPVHVSNVYASLQGVAGLAGLDITLLQYKNSSDAMSHGATTDPVQIHMRINDNELATLEDSIGDALITLGQTPA